MKECNDCDFDTTFLTYAGDIEWNYCPVCGRAIDNLETEIPINENNQQNKQKSDQETANEEVRNSTVDEELERIRKDLSDEDE